MAPRTPILLKEVVYTLSPFEQSVTSGLWRDFSYKITKQIREVSVHMFDLVSARDRFAEVCNVVFFFIFKILN